MNISQIDAVFDSLTDTQKFQAWIAVTTPMVFREGGWDEFQAILKGLGFFETGE